MVVHPMGWSQLEGTHVYIIIVGAIRVDFSVGEKRGDAAGAARNTHNNMDGPRNLL